MKETVLNDKQLVNKILDKLNSILEKKGNKLPDKGFLCGGAVSNYIYALEHNLEPVINDIDIFINDRGNERLLDLIDEDELESRYRGGYYNNTITTDIQLITTGYGRTYLTSKNERFTMITHERINDLNYVYCDVISENKHPYDIILQSFDINNCQSGIDLETGKLHYTKEFVQFIKTKQIKSNIPITPVHTLIRLIKKTKELGCYIDMEKEVQLCSLASEITNNVIGPITYEKYLTVKDEIDKYFDVTEQKQRTYDDDDFFKVGDIKSSNTYHSFTPKNNFKNTLLEDYSVNDVYVLRKYFDFFVYKNKRGTQNKLNLIKHYNTEHKKPLQQETKNNSSGIDDLFGVREVRNDIKDLFTFNMLFVKDGYHLCDFSGKHIVEINDFLKEHPMLCKLLVKCDNLIDQYNIVKFIKSLSKKEGGFIIGFLELSNLNGIDTINKDIILDLIEKKKNEDKNTLISPIDLSGFEFIDSVRELCTNLELKKEGHMMGHCVGGYSSKISNGTSRIFHIHRDNIGSTFEILCPKEFKYNDHKLIESKILNYDKDFKFFISNYCNNINGVISPKNEVSITQWIKYCHNDILQYGYLKNQHYGKYPEKGNLTPIESHQNIGRVLRDFLNKNTLSGYNKIIMDILYEKINSLNKYLSVINSQTNIYI